MNTLQNDLEEFGILTSFLGAFGPGIEPRGTELTDGERQLLSSIADGSSSQDERDEALPLLTGNTTALEFLAIQLNGEA